MPLRGHFCCWKSVHRCKRGAGSPLEWRPQMLVSLMRGFLSIALLTAFLAGCQTVPVSKPPPPAGAGAQAPTPSSSATATESGRADSAEPAAPVAAEGLPAPIEPPPTVSPTPRRIKVGLALGGGAARGFAHIGVIKALESHGIVPDLVIVGSRPARSSEDLPDPLMP